MKPYLTLGYLPLSNNLGKAPDDPIHNERYPLEVCLCESCGLSQLSVVIPPEQMFSHYVYRSSISQGYIDHCKLMAIELKEKYNLTEDSFCIDIAGNDGALLSQFVDVIGCRTLNIDPAENMVAINEAKGIRQFTTFWGYEAAKHLDVTQWPKADIITATNVFAHVDNVYEFIDAVKYVLKPQGKLILEFPYLIDFIENKEFDTVYFEHLSYFSITPLNILVTSLGLNIEDISRHDIHGGSVRVTIGYGEQGSVVADYLTDELQYRKLAAYESFTNAVVSTISQFREFMLSTKSVAGFAASAKGNTLLNCAGITNDQMRYIVDETPEKIGMFSPGTKIPIVPMAALIADSPEYLVILSWNFASEIIKKCRAYGYKGKFVIPIPEWKVV